MAMDSSIMLSKSGASLGRDARRSIFCCFVRFCICFVPYGLGHWRNGLRIFWLVYGRKF